MSNFNPDENLPGPFKNGRLTDPEESGTTRPNRVNRQTTSEQNTTGQEDGEQTRAVPVNPETGTPSSAPEIQSTDQNGQTRPHPVHDPHGQTQELPSQPQPVRANPGQTSPVTAQPAPISSQGISASQKGQSDRSKARSFSLGSLVRRYWLWGVLAVFVFGGTILTGGYGGYLSGRAERSAQAEAAAVSDLNQQVTLGFEDLQSGRYDVARQRFEFVINQDPNFPGAADGLVEALQVLNATATPSPPPATPTMTPTRDLRPVEELLAQALTQMRNSDWAGVINTLNGLRKEDPDYQVTRVDGYLYIALRYQGVDKILNQSNLEGGIYDLSLAEQFGPLDSEALGVRNLARLYIIGSSFWEAIPEQAVYYFSQVASAAPYLRDASGWTARERYRQSLVQYGDKLAASGDWCEAQVQYETALSMQDDAAIGEKAQEAALTCSPPTDVPTVAPTETPTPTPSLTVPAATTAVPTAPVATTPAETTPAATTAVPTTAAPTTAAPTTAAPTTPAPTSPPATTEPPPPVETTPPPPPESPVPTETTPPPADLPSATTISPLQETPTEPTTEPPAEPTPAESTQTSSRIESFLGLLPNVENSVYA